jgi:hypothetical protein
MVPSPVKRSLIRFESGPDYKIKKLKVICSSNGKVLKMIDLKNLEEILDEMLSIESSETLADFINKKRNEMTLKEEFLALVSREDEQTLADIKNKIENLETSICYVVRCSSGSYDDYRTWIAGIFPYEIDAENLKNEIIAQVEAGKNNPCPFDKEALESLTDEQIEIYQTWWIDNNNACEFNSAIVLRYPFGKPFSVRYDVF